jgi:autoinducer 2-degrading protein
VFTLIVHFVIKPEHAEEFLAAVVRQAINSKQQEPACLQFDVNRSPSDPTHFFLYEVYINAAAFDAHKQTLHFADFSKTVADMIQSKEVTFFDRIEPGT